MAIGAALDLRGVPEQLIAGAAAGGFLLAFALAYPRGMGMGDVKLAAVLGLFFGRSVAVAILVGVLTATLVGAWVMARVGVEKGRKTAVPFGPFLALGGVIGLLAGPTIIHWYLHAGSVMPAARPTRARSAASRCRWWPGSRSRCSPALAMTVTHHAGAPSVAPPRGDPAALRDPRVTAARSCRLALEPRGGDRD